MLKDITIGQFFPGESPIHKVDPRMKIVLTMAFIILIFFIKSFYGYFVLFAFLLSVVFMSKVPLKFVLKGLKPLLIIIILTFLINIFFTPGGRVYYSKGIFKITEEGLRIGIFMAVRLIFLVIGTSILTLTTSPIALTDGIERLLMPLRVIKFPAHELAMMMTIALRFIPTLLEETDKIMKAQMARGADFESGNIFKRAKSLVPLLVPLFISSFRRADELAMAMEARCYRGGDNRTRMKVLTFTSVDYIALVYTIVLLTASVVFGRILA